MAFSSSTAFAGRAVAWGALPVLPGTIFTNIAAGAHHSIAITTTGGAIAWGSLEGVPAYVSNLVAVSAGGFPGTSSHNLGLGVDGSVFAWGVGSYSANYEEIYGETSIPAGLSNVVALAAGGGHNLALKSDGTVLGWGYNAYGEATGAGSSSSATGQVMVAGQMLSNVVAIAAGTYHSVALKNDGRTVSWGQYPPPGASNVAAIGAGYNFTAFLFRDGTMTSQGSPGVYIAGSNLVALAVGGDVYGNHVVALTSDGHVLASGANDYGQSSVPAGLSNVVAVAAGSVHSHALKADGTLVSWGYTNFGYAPLLLSNVVAVAGGTANLALRSNGTVAGLFTNQTVPAGLSNISAISYGYGEGMALRKNGTVVAWSEVNQTYNPSAASLSNIMAIAAGTYHNLALQSNGTIIQMRGSLAQTVEVGVPPGLSNVVAISISGWNPPVVQGGSGPGDFGLALKNDGTLVAWGGYSYETNVPGDLSNVVAIAAGGFHSLALKNDGTVEGWGLNQGGEATGIPNTVSPYASTGQVMLAGQVLSNVIAIAAGNGHSLALKNDGMIAAWGWNNDSQATVPAGVSNVIAIAAGDSESLAIIQDLQISSVAASALGTSLGFHTFAGQRYAVEYSASINPANWVTLPSAGNIIGNGQDVQVSDTSTSGTRTRFYRLRLLH